MLLQMITVFDSDEWLFILPPPKFQSNFFFSFFAKYDLRELLNAVKRTH